MINLFLLSLQAAFLGADIAKGSEWGVIIGVVCIFAQSFFVSREWKK